MDNFENDIDYLKELIRRRENRQRILSHISIMYNRLSLLHNADYINYCTKRINTIFKEETNQNLSSFILNN